MSNEEHLIENCLFEYAKSIKNNLENPYLYEENEIIKKQFELCKIDPNVMREFVCYIYWSLLDTEELRQEVFEGV